MQTMKQRKETYLNPFEPVDNSAQLREALLQIDKQDLRTKFKSTSDPIHLAFDTIENTSLKTLAVDFVKESFFDIADFIVSICK